MSDKYLIWSTVHNLWWRALGLGYSSSLGEAGRFSKTTALELCAVLHGSIRDLPLAEEDARFLYVAALRKSALKQEGHEMAKGHILLDIALVCHEANRAYCISLGDDSQKSWSEAPEWQRSSALKGVSFLIAHPDADHGALHDNWVRDKVAAGWVVGPIKDEAKRTHPCLIPFNELPKEQQLKDNLFMAIVRALQ